MIKIALSIMISSMIFCSIGHGSNSLQEVYCHHPHRIFFGPDFFWFDVDTTIKNAKIDDSQPFFGLRIGYEHLKPCSFYFGLDLFSAYAGKSLKMKYCNSPFFRDIGGTGFGNIETRFGYSLTPKRYWLVTPIIGIGAYAYGCGNKHFGFEESLAYVLGGVRNECALTNYFHLGVNLKTIYAWDVEKKFKRSCGIKLKENENFWGGEIGISFVWHVGTCRRWDIQLEPYYFRLGFSENQNIYGTRLLFGYRF